MNSQSRVTLSLPASLVTQLTHAARADGRSRSNLAARYLSVALTAGRDRLAELERAARAEQPDADNADAARAASADHLRRHAELGGTDTPRPDTTENEMHRNDEDKFHHPHAPRIAPRLGERGERERDTRDRSGTDPDFAAPVPARPRPPEQ